MSFSSIDTSQSIHQLTDQWVIRLVQQSQLLRAYNTIINNGNWPKPLDEEKQSPSTVGTIHTLTLDDIAITIKTWLQDNHSRILSQLITYKTDEIKTLLQL